MKYDLIPGTCFVVEIIKWLGGGGRFEMQIAFH